MSVIIWHNPRCSKSRATLALLEEHGADPEIRLYQDNAPSASEIEDALKKLGLEPRDLMRKGEDIYKSHNLGDPGLDRAALIKAMATHPILIERPVVLANGKAAIGRPPESVLEIL